MCGDSVKVTQSLFQRNEGSAILTSSLQFTVEYIHRKDFKKLNELWHSKLPLCRNCFEGFCFGLFFNSRCYAVAWWSKPIASNRFKDWRTMLELRRMAICNEAPKNTASRMLSVMIRIIRKNKPYIKRFISYQDTEVHSGTIYKASGWTPISKSKFTTWKNRGDFKRIDQSKADKIRWEYNLGGNQPNIK